MALPDLKSMSTGDLDALIQSAALERAKREPPVTMDQPTTMEAALDPKWYLSMSDENTFLQLRHPGYGWVGYVIPPAPRAALATFLLQHSLLPPTKPETAPPVPSTGGGTVH